MRIQDIFVLKEGLPIYHHKEKYSKLKESLDDTLITGFLSAIINFTKETGLGVPIFYVTDSIRFSFFEKSGLLYIISSDPSLPNSYMDELFTKLSSSFLNQVNEESDSLEITQINNFVDQVLNDLGKKYDCLLNSAQKDQPDEHYFREIIPRKYIDDNDNLKDNRRKLFKLIDGKNSIYDLAIQMNSPPSRILSILRSYKKEGIISF